MPFYEFVCEDGHVTVARKGLSEREAPCGDCGQPAQRQFSVPYVHGSTTPKFQPDPERFLDRAQEIDYAYTKADNEVGARVSRPRGYRAGLVRARAMLMEREGLTSRNTKLAFELDERGG